MDVLGLEGFERNYGKFKGLLQKGESIRDKLMGPKCNKIKSWPMEIDQHLPGRRTSLLATGLHEQWLEEQLL